jgi:hypothetical protein
MRSTCGITRKDMREQSRGRCHFLAHLTLRGGLFLLSRRLLLRLETVLNRIIRMSQPAAYQILLYLSATSAKSSQPDQQPCSSEPPVDAKKPKLKVVFPLKVREGCKQRADPQDSVGTQDHNG